MTDKIALSVSETAELLGVSRPTVYNLVCRNDFPSFTVGNRRLISKAGLERWIDEQIGNGVKM